MCAWPALKSTIFILVPLSLSPSLSPPLSLFLSVSFSLISLSLCLSLSLPIFLPVSQYLYLSPYISPHALKVTHRSNGRYFSEYELGHQWNKNDIKTNSWEIKEQGKEGGREKGIWGLAMLITLINSIWFVSFNFIPLQSGLSAIHGSCRDMIMHWKILCWMIMYWMIMCLL